MRLLASAVSAPDALWAFDLIDATLKRVAEGRDALVSRAALPCQSGDAEQAASALDRILSWFAVPRSSGYNVRADEVAARAGCSGWVGATGLGVAVSHAARTELRADGARSFRTAAGAREHGLPLDDRMLELIGLRETARG
jgi:hypothetical protein